ncbi:MAG: PDZ domain-containing protein, partial [Candidatus Aminicenantes bacterium]
MRNLLALFPILILLVFGSLNIYKKITWEEPTDGVTWIKKTEGLTAVKVEVNSPGYNFNIKKGDVLYSINGNKIENKIELAKSLWFAGHSDQRVTYEIAKGGDIIFPSFNLYKKGVDPLYFYLAFIGLTTLVIGVIIFFTSKRSLSMPYIHFYFISLALYSFYMFSPTGKLDTLDSVFYWLDAFAFLVFPPLLLHFFLTFPQRKRILNKKNASIFILYIPGGLLLLAKIALHIPGLNSLSDSLILRLHMASEKLDLLHFAL